MCVFLNSWISLEMPTLQGSLPPELANNVVRVCIISSIYSQCLRINLFFLLMYSSLLVGSCTVNVFVELHSLVSRWVFLRFVYELALLDLDTTVLHSLCLVWLIFLFHINTVDVLKFITVLYPHIYLLVSLN